VMIAEITSDERENEIVNRRVADVAAWFQQYNVMAFATAEPSVIFCGEGQRARF